MYDIRHPLGRWRDWGLLLVFSHSVRDNQVKGSRCGRGGDRWDAKQGQPNHEEANHKLIYFQTRRDDATGPVRSVTKQLLF